MPQPAHLIACRIYSYGEFVEEAWTHLPSLGVRHIEMACPPAGELPEWKRRLADHGLQASSLHCACEIRTDDAVEKMKTQFDCFPELGTHICFTSVHAGDTPRDTVWERLRRIGDEAAARDVVVAMETHPDLVENAKKTLATMAAVNHSHIRVNFDTANIYYYNRGTTAVDELAGSADFVAAIHLKESTGAYQTHDFPTLGDGVVDFPAVFKLMDNRGFAGPYTIELEGSQGLQRDRAAQLKYVADSVDYLKRIGVM